MTQGVAACYGGGYAAPSTEQNQSWIVPLAAVALTGVAGLGAAAIISAVELTATAKRRNGGRCFQRAVERLFEDRLTYTEEKLRETLLELTIRKFQREGLSRSEVEPAARESMRKSLRRGLSPRKMERFLNDHVGRLRELSSPSLKGSLRDFERYETKGQDLSEFEASALFPCHEVKRYIVLSFQKLDKMRKGDPAHFDPIRHNGKAWIIANKSPVFLMEGSATREDAKRALEALAMRKYGTRGENGIHTIFSERA